VILAVSGLCSSAAAGLVGGPLLSFASDNDSDAFTFRGTAAAGNTFSIRNGRDPMANPLMLRIDDRNGSLPTVSMNVGFLADFTATWQGSVGVAGNFAHVYSVLGTFGFVNPANPAQVWLTGTVSNASTPGILTIPGPANQWGSAGSISGSDVTANFAGAVVYTATQALINAAQGLGINLAPYFISPGTSISPDDFAFSMSVLTSGPGAVPISPITRLPTSGWQSEGSYSGATFLIPAPGALGLLAWGGVVAAGRGRRAR
jgi:hypothetical protein